MKNKASATTDREFMISRLLAWVMPGVLSYYFWNRKKEIAGKQLSNINR